MDIEKIDKMSHKELVKNSHSYKDYLKRHPKTKEILETKKGRAIEKVMEKNK